MIFDDEVILRFLVEQHLKDLSDPKVGLDFKQYYNSGLMILLGKFAGKKGMVLLMKLNLKLPFNRFKNKTLMAELKRVQKWSSDNKVVSLWYDLLFFNPPPFPNHPPLFILKEESQSGNMDLSLNK